MVAWWFALGWSTPSSSLKDQQPQQQQQQLLAKAQEVATTQGVGRHLSVRESWSHTFCVGSTGGILHTNAYIYIYMHTTH